MSVISDRIKEAMEKTGISQTELCNKTGLSKSSISQYLSGKNEPRKDKIQLIANALYVSSYWLCGQDKMSVRISVEEAAKLMGVSKQFIRVGLQNGSLPFGKAVKITGDKYTYYISPKRFNEFTGMTVEG